MQFNGKEYVKPAAFAAKWGCATQTVYNYIRRGLIPGAFKYEGHWYVPRNTKMPEFSSPRPGVKPGNAKSRPCATSSQYDIWCNDIERHSWSKLFLEV